MKTKRKKRKIIKQKVKPIKGFKKIEAKPLTEEQIKQFVSFFNKHKRFPGSKIPCSVTGKLTTCVGPWMKKKIKEFGSAEDLLRGYKCRQALKATRQIIKPVSKRKIKAKKIKDEQNDWSIPKIDFTPPRALTIPELQETTKTQCMRPDIFLSNGRHCDGCEYFESCQNDLKTLPKFLKTKKGR